MFFTDAASGRLPPWLDLIGLLFLVAATVIELRGGH